MLSTLFYRHPRLNLLCIGLALISGAAALTSLSRAEDPALARRFGTITTFFPGASALRIEALVTEPIEARLRELHEIRTVESTSRTGASMIFIEFADEYGEDEVDAIWSKVRDRVAHAAGVLPPGASVPEVEDRTTTAITPSAPISATRSLMMASLRSSTTRSGSGILASVMQFSGSSIPGRRRRDRD